jgi:hypothetical protein
MSDAEGTAEFLVSLPARELSEMFLSPTSNEPALSFPKFITNKLLDDAA